MSAAKEKGNEALLVVDIQEDYTGKTARPPFPYKDSEQLITTVNKIIEAASKKNIMVIYIRHEFEGFFWKMFSKIFFWGTDIKGTPGTAIDKRIKIVSNYSFKKPLPSAFSNQKLEAFLKKHHIHKLYIVGLDAQFCIHATAKGALRRRFNVAVIKDAIALKAENKWDKLLGQFDKEGVTLVTKREFVEEKALKTRTHGTTDKVASK